MEDLEGFKKVALKFLIPVYFDVLVIQPDLLIRSIATSLYSFVMGFFLQFLYIKKVLTINFYQLFQLFS